MIKSNSFYIKNLKNVVFIGEHGSLKELVKINKSLKLNSKNYHLKRSKQFY